ncbi:hypothetical protein AB4Z34_14745 [Ensifer sp. 2YAB10]|uniref:hypothetical protein n=1 Tax=unclassified Ensifer TaxID=2633371 RepID=UPI003F91C7BB
MTLPSIGPAIISSVIVALFIMGGKETLPMMIWANLKYELTPALTAIASLLIVFTFACILPAEYYRRRKLTMAAGAEA